MYVLYILVCMWEYTNWDLVVIIQSSHRTVLFFSYAYNFLVCIWCEVWVRCEQWATSSAIMPLAVVTPFVTPLLQIITVYYTTWAVWLREIISSLTLLVCIRLTLVLVCLFFTYVIVAVVQCAVVNLCRPCILRSMHWRIDCLCVTDVCMCILCLVKEAKNEVHVDSFSSHVKLTTFF